MTTATPDTDELEDLLTDEATEAEEPCVAGTETPPTNYAVSRSVSEGKGPCTAAATWIILWECGCRRPLCDHHKNRVITLDTNPFGWSCTKHLDRRGTNKIVSCKPLGKGRA